MSPNRSIREHLIALMAAFALPLVALQVWSNYREYRTTVETAESRALTLATATAASTEQFLTVAEDAMTGFADQFGASMLAAEHCGTVVRPLNEAFGFLVNTMALDAEGRIVCSANARPDSLVHRADAVWFQEAMSTGRFVLGDPVFGAISGTWVVAVGAPIRNEDGETVGVLAGSIPVLQMQDLLVNVGVTNRDLVTLATEDFRVVARSREAERWIGKVLPMTAGVESRVGDDQWLASGDDFDGIDRSWGHVQMAGPRWHVYVGIPSEDAVAPAIRAAREKIGYGLIFMGLGTLLAAGFYRRISGSLHEVVVRTRDAADGTPVSAPVGAPLEVVELVDQFNQTLAEQVRAETSERQAHARYQSVFNNAVFGIYVSTRDGHFLETNPALVEMLGFDSAEALMRAGPGALYAIPDKRSALIAEYQEQGIIENLEADWVKADGQPIVVRLNGKVIRLRSGEPAFEVIVQDVTEEKLREEELRQTQKMEAVGRLAGGIAHDFNNLLTVIGGNLELLKSGLTPDDPMMEDVAQIVDATGRATELTRQLLSFSRKDAGTATSVDAAELIAVLEKMLGRLIRDDITLETLPPTGELAANMDRGQLEQVLMNLVLNARDALPAGGRIVVQARPAVAGGPTHVEQSHGDGVLITVWDNGTGMDEDTRLRIFEPFFTTKPKGEGTGLGLSTVYGIVRQAGGHIHVESQLGRGTTFEIWLPAALDESPDVRVPVEAVSPTARTSGSETILAVEDEALVRGIVKRVLEGAGYRVLVASDGQEALDMSAMHDGPIDLVVTDVVMPRVKGPELAERLAFERPETPVLFMSGYTGDLPFGERIADDPDSFLSKPFSPTDLSSRVRTLLDRREDSVSAVH